jgi:hypothetical protein
MLKDSKKWEDSFALWLELENNKGNDTASTGDVIDIDGEGPATSGLATPASRPQGHQGRHRPSSRLLGVAKNLQGAHDLEGRGHCREGGAGA